MLVYTSEPLMDDLEVTGPVLLKLYAACSAPDTDFVAKLTDVYPDGRSINLTEGVIRARFRKRQWDRNPNTGHEPGLDAELQIARQTVLHDRHHPSHLVLPVIPAR